MPIDPDLFIFVSMPLPQKSGIYFLLYFSDSVDVLLQRFYDNYINLKYTTVVSL